jgi:hypothetical protein
MPTSFQPSPVPLHCRCMRSLRRAQNEILGNSHIDDAHEHFPKDDIALTLRALQQALHRTNECFGHAQQWSQRRRHDGAPELFAEEKKQRRSSESRGDDMQLNRRQRKVAKGASRNGRKPRLVAPADGKGPGSSADPNLFCTLSSMSFDFGYYLGEGDR